ncbi:MULTISPECIES: helix-turn-helix transcriptional regulator [Pantoea]|jgi:putative transcriptional regulator|uniref:Transcriptional regulator n=2 Tax=Pantoea TaxID=53335 RepID=A0A1I3YQ47_9GAMM|nr:MULTISPECIES: helix-turn-helix transcriptional regulator [Pantoea]MRT27089.1 helix-turn-helix domain-containing protein [Enterobacteriaceae bacterium RIT697]MEA5101461.1 helix-turn-helix transcriptional regulator [Pantoea sp. S18]PLR26334.1 XRE family transcriptional regulator [Pantoea endophytica]SFK33915.1 putative transcriptional regulator [Pantoea symbiotica]SFU86794.1 putative transcriptional regulator [Pantoea sp. YR525]
MNNLALIRKKIGISQAVLAKSIGWGPSRIANYESNIRTPSLASCRLILKGLETLGHTLTIDEVFPP